MVAVRTRSTLWRDLSGAWLSCGSRADDIPDRSAERQAAALLRQYLFSSVILGTTVAICGATIAVRPPSSLAAVLAIAASLALGYLFFLTELSSLPQELRSIPALRSRKIRQMRLATAAIGGVETFLPGGLVLAVLVTAW